MAALNDVTEIRRKHIDLKLEISWRFETFKAVTSFIFILQLLFCKRKLMTAKQEILILKRKSYKNLKHEQCLVTKEWKFAARKITKATPIKKLPNSPWKKLPKLNFGLMLSVANKWPWIGHGYTLVSNLSSLCIREDYIYAFKINCLFQRWSGIYTHSAASLLYIIFFMLNFRIFSLF